jgi:hypothetical protein
MGTQIGDILSFEKDPSFRGLQDSREGEQKSRLSRSIGAQERDDLSVFYLQRDFF